MKEKTEADNVNIVNLFRWADWEEGWDISYHFAMELALCDLGSRVKHVNQLRDCNDDQFKVEQSKLPGFIYGAAKGLSWIHNSRILHRDVKPGNVLIFETSSGQQIAKSPPKSSSPTSSIETDNSNHYPSDFAHSSRQTSMVTGNTNAMKRVTLSSTDDDDNSVPPPVTGLKRSESS
ncbi:unnamed protein product [Orchesella dallaii]|uniref:Protein kinase domain-containing protein n=1 Tax=Orchesella dallaii TaxID=48710 RepID=A0ABP1RTX9_9HEXA